MPRGRPAAAQGVGPHAAHRLAAAAYYNAVWDRTLELTFHDQMQQSVWPTGNSRWFEVMRRLLEEPYSPWWDNADTETVVETRDDILYQAMTSA